MISRKETIEQVTNENRLLEPVIERLGFSKGYWNKSIEDACLEQELNLDFVVQILNAFDETGNFPKEELMKFPIPMLLDYLKKTHKYYLSKKLPEIELSIAGLREHFEETHPLQVVLGELFLNYKNSLISHIEMEEEKLFPYIEYLVEKSNDASPINEMFQSYSIAALLQGHEDVEEQLVSIKKIITNFTESTGEVMPFLIFLNQITNLEKDLNKHAMVEDEILLPKAINLEKNIK